MSVASAQADAAMLQDVTIDDFVTGLVAGLAADNVEAVSLRGKEFYDAIAEVYRELRATENEAKINLRFRVILDEVYGDSPIVRDAISGAVQRDLVSLDNPEYLDMRLKVGPAEAALLLKSLPGPAGLFETLARHFLAKYPWIVLHRETVNH